MKKGLHQLLVEVSENLTVEPFLTLDEIKALPQIAGAYYVKNEKSEAWSFRLRVIRERRDDGTRALHPQISASDGEERITLALSKSHGWHIQQHNGNIEFNREVLSYLNKGLLSIDQQVRIAISED